MTQILYPPTMTPPIRIFLIEKLMLNFNSNQTQDGPFELAPAQY